MVAPTLWLLYAVFIVKEHTLRQAWATVWRTVVLTAGVSLWWAWALAIESGYGLNVLGVTEKVSAVAKTSLSSEVLRGLGYWFFYGSDIAGPWAATSAGFTQQLWLIGLTFAVPAARPGGRRRRPMAPPRLLHHPRRGGDGARRGVEPLRVAFDGGRVHQGLHDQDHRRSGPAVHGPRHAHGAARTGRAARRRRHRPRPAPPGDRGLASTGLALGLVAAANPPAWNGSTVLDRYTFPTPVPSYVTQAANALNAQNTDTRVFAIPGDNFGAYRYGNTVDPIWPGLLTRPFVTREQLPLGSLPSYDMTYALDVPMQNRTADPAALAPMARLMSVGRRPRAERHRLRALRPPSTAVVLAVAASPPGRALGPGRLRDAPAQRVVHPHGRRVHAGGADATCLAAPLEVLSVATPRARRAGANPPRARWSWPGTPWGSTTRPGSVCSTPTRRCSTRAPSTRTTAPLVERVGRGGDAAW